MKSEPSYVGCYLVFDSNHPLVNSSDRAQFKFAHPTSLVNAFDQTRSLEPVNFNGWTDSHLAQRVRFSVV